MEMLGLTGKQKTHFGELSCGQRQRLSIALALVGRPAVVVLDELTTGLDPQARRDTWALIEGVRDRGTTIVLVTHFMAEAERLCDRIAVFDFARIVAWTPRPPWPRARRRPADHVRRTGRWTRPSCWRCPRSAACNGAATRSR